MWGGDCRGEWCDNAFELSDCLRSSEGEVRDGRIFVFGAQAGNSGGNVLTSATGAESSIAVTARFANSNHFSIDVLGVVGFDVGRTATAVGNINGIRHFDRRNLVAEMSVGYGIWLRWVGGGRVLKVCDGKS
jgi:hypothetical protein